MRLRCLSCDLRQANRAHTYLGKREAEWHDTGDEKDIYPDFPTMAKSFGVPARRVIKKSELRAGGFFLVFGCGIEMSCLLKFVRQGRHTAEYFNNRQMYLVWVCIFFPKCGLCHIA